MAWQGEVHRPGIYDVEVDTSRATAAACAERIHAHLDAHDGPLAFERLRRGDRG